MTLSESYMQIPLEDGIIVDTDNLTDKEAEIYEAIKKLSDVCRKYGVTSFLRVIINNDKFVGMHTVAKNEIQLQKDFDFLMSAINSFVTDVSSGQVVMMRVKPPDTPA